MNPQALNTQQAVDPVFILIFGISLVMLVGITLTMVYFIVRYNSKRHPAPTSDVRYNIPLEILWTAIPTLLVLAMFYYGWSGYLALRNVPKDAMEVTATARMWSWTFAYENGRTSDKLFVPAGRPVRVHLVSEDVLHAFYIPAFRIKRDTVPGMDNYVWFNATEPGSYHIFCAEYCGTGHADMITTVQALPPHEFTEWLQQEKPHDEISEGEKLLNQYGCIGCHSLDGSKKTGPTFKGLWGKEVQVETDGQQRTLTVDQEYILRSIFEPNADVVVGYPAVMPSYQDRMTQHEAEEIAEYFETQAQMPAGEPEVKEDEEAPARKAEKPEAEKAETEKAKAEKAEAVQAPGPRRGQELVARKGCVGCHSTDGTEKTGPTFKGLYGKEVEVEEGGEKKTVTADEFYLRNSITDPQAQVVKGYPPIMPAYPDLTEEELQAIVDYLQALK